MFVLHGIRRGLADRTVLYFRGFACKAASVVISGSIRRREGSSNDCFETKLRTSLDKIHLLFAGIEREFCYELYRAITAFQELANLT